MGSSNYKHLYPLGIPNTVIQPFPEEVGGRNEEREREREGREGGRERGRLARTRACNQVLASRVQAGGTCCAGHVVATTHATHLLRRNATQWVLVCETVTSFC